MYFGYNSMGGRIRPTPQMQTLCPAGTQLQQAKPEKLVYESKKVESLVTSNKHQAEALRSLKLKIPTRTLAICGVCSAAFYGGLLQYLWANRKQP